ncbi:MAG: hypothetical protein HY287_04515 [Planctomycetes bacterium]|nr:hypothetical protein [Planctomycetota bacterium]MBI3833577.1 hypothetical protein [Planctomycetota bacterium]
MNSQPRSLVRVILLQPIRDALACLEALAVLPRPTVGMVLMIISLVACWFLYVAPHELLHALGCIVTGGSVTRVEMSPIYGASIYAKWFPFIVSGSEYAGQVTGFDKSTDFRYFATDYMPFVLSILLGVPLLKISGRRPHPILLGIGVVVGLAPFYSLPGDYYEMGSTLTTRAVTIVTRGFGHPPLFESLRSDDVFKLVSEMFSKPAEFGLGGFVSVAKSAAIVFVSGILGIMLAFLTYWLGHLWSVYVLRIRPVMVRPQSTSPN